MNRPEILKSPELPKRGRAPVRPWDSDLSAEAADEVLRVRRRMLEDLKSSVSLNFYYQVEARLKSEEKEFAVLLDFSQAQSAALSRYSFVLNPAYFEQKLL